MITLSVLQDLDNPHKFYILERVKSILDNEEHLILHGSYPDEEGARQNIQELE